MFEEEDKKTFKEMLTDYKEAKAKAKAKKVPEPEKPKDDNKEKKDEGPGLFDWLFGK